MVGAHSHEQSPADAAQRAHKRRTRALRWRQACAVAAILLTVVVLAGYVPGLVGTAVAVALPWLGVFVLLLAGASFTLRRGWWIALVPLLIWVIAIAPAITWVPARAGSVANDELVFASQNVEAGSGTAGVSAAELAERGADVIVLTELDGESRELADDTLRPTHPYSSLVGTVGLWSTVPIIDAIPLDLDLGWRRALHAQLQTDAGEVSVYVVHAASFRPGEQRDRDAMLGALGDEIAADDTSRIVALGDFNAATTDPALASIRRNLAEARQARPGVTFTWPAALPVARIDHVFQRGFRARGGEAFVAGESDHLAILSVLAM